MNIHFNSGINLRLAVATMKDEGANAIFVTDRPIDNHIKVAFIDKGYVGKAFKWKPVKKFVIPKHHITFITF